ncbi:MAG: hypothetical protein WCC60_16040 [Ilumatobacteraceae bacterium]
MEVVWIILIVVAMGAMWWVAYRMEPHWSSRDGRRFFCTAQELTGGESTGHPKETRVSITPDGALYISQKHLMRRRTSVWSIVGKSPSPPPKLQIYVAQHRADAKDLPSHLAIRIPRNSRCIAVLDELVAAAELKASRPTRGSAAPAGPPEQD